MSLGAFGLLKRGQLQHSLPQQVNEKINWVGLKKRDLAHITIKHNKDIVSDKYGTPRPTKQSLTSPPHPLGCLNQFHTINICLII